MSELPMVEKVAIAINLASGAMLSPPVSIALARAAIEAMRNPTQSVLAAGDDAAKVDGEFVGDIWAAMIDEALK